MKKHKVNELIRFKEVMAIDVDGTKLGTIPTEEAIRLAKAKQLDLVEVSPNSTPPVCKIMDFGKFKYKSSKKKHESKKKMRIIKVKEVKMTPTIGIHDFDFKVDHAKKFLGEGDKVKVTIIFKGRMVVHQDIGIAVLNRVIEETEETAIVEQTPKKEGRNLFIMLLPKHNPNPS